METIQACYSDDVTLLEITRDNNLDLCSEINVWVSYANFEDWGCDKQQGS